MKIKTVSKMPTRLQSTAASTFQFQNKLPHLPVPPLAETGQKYLQTIRPFLNDKQFKESSEIVASFVREGGVGQELQRRLQQRARERKNWVYEWWNDDAYLKFRDPIVPYVSYFYSFQDQPDKFSHPSQRAAAIITSALNFKDLLDAETLPPDYMRKQPIDMELFRFLFNTCRIPHLVRDETVTYSNETHQHIVVMRRNRFYSIAYRNEKTKKRLTLEEIELKIRSIYADAELRGPGPNIGGLSSENRDIWAKARDRLLHNSPVNAKNLEAIQSAAFLVCLDWAAPVSDIERTNQYWHGYNRNRFYDKPVQFIINDNGTAGFMGEHSMMDGTQTLRLNEYVLSDLFTKPFTSNVFKQIDDDEVTELQFQVSKKIEEDIVRAECDFRKEIERHEVAIWHFEDYGKNAIKGFGVSPDAYLQMLLQLAYYRMHGRVRPTYESATTRKFAQGRTETTRSVSVESAELCSKFWNLSVSDADKIAAFRTAIQSHVRYVAEATEGRGVDRHLFGLRKCLMGNEKLPGIYRDPIFGYSSSWYISSSQLSSEYLNGYGWSQVIPEGFGCAYMINKNSLHVNICSQRMGSNQFMEYLDIAAVKLAKLLGTETPVSRL